MLNVTVPVVLDGNVAVYVTNCVYVCGDGRAVAVNALTLTVSLLTAGSPSVEEMRAELVTEPRSAEDSVTGIVISGREVPAPMADAGVYVQVTV